ncbi:unnamed protein product [Lampetra fluviatilis]
MRVCDFQRHMTEIQGVLRACQKGLGETAQSLDQLPFCSDPDIAGRTPVGWHQWDALDNTAKEALDEAARALEQLRAPVPPHSP